MLRFYIDKAIFFTNFICCREGATGDDIVDALIANSSTFGKKTAFSQVSLVNKIQLAFY